MAEGKPVTRDRLENLERRTRATTFEMVPGDKASPAPPNARDVLDLIAEVRRLQSALAPRRTSALWCWRRSSNSSAMEGMAPVADCRLCEVGPGNYMRSALDAMAAAENVAG